MSSGSNISLKGHTNENVLAALPTKESRELTFKEKLGGLPFIFLFCFAPFSPEKNS